MASFTVPSRRVWTRQPPAVAKLDSSNPICRDVAAVWSPFSPNQMMGGRPMAAAGETAYNASPVGTPGIGRKWSRTANAGVDFGIGKIITSGASTLLVVAAPANAAAIKCAFSQRQGSGSFPQIDFLFNASNDGLSPTAGNVQMVNYDGASRSLIATSQTDGKPHCWVASNSPSAGYLIRDGIKQTLSLSTRSTSNQASGTQKIRIGNIADDTSTTYQHDDPLYLVAVWNRQLSEDEAKSISLNPWQLFKLPARRVFIPQFTGNALNATAAGTDTATGTASLAAQVALAAVGITSANGNGTATVSVPLAATGLAVADGTANATATVSISAAGLAQAAGQAGLSAAVLLAGAGAAQAAGNAELAAQLQAMAAGADQAGGTAGLSASLLIAAAAAAQASGNATLAASLAAQASGIAQASGTANLSGGAPGALQAIGSSASAGQAVLTVTVDLQAAGGSTAAGLANGTASSPTNLAAAGQAAATGAGTLRATVEITAAGFVHAMGNAALSIEIPLSAFAAAIASGTATLHEVTGQIPVSPLRMAPTIARQAALRASINRPLILRAGALNA